MEFISNKKGTEKTEWINRSTVMVVGFLCIISALAALFGSMAGTSQRVEQERRIKIAEQQALYGDAASTSVEVTKPSAAQWIPQLFGASLLLGTGIGLLLFKRWGRTLFMVTAVISVIQRVMGMIMLNQQTAMYQQPLTQGGHMPLVGTAQIINGFTIILMIWLFFRFNAKEIRQLFE